MHGTMVARRLDGGSTEALARITFEVITFEPLRVVRTDFTGFQWQHRAARHEARGIDTTMLLSPGSSLLPGQQAPLAPLSGTVAW